MSNQDPWDVSDSPPKPHWFGIILPYFGLLSGFAVSYVGLFIFFGAFAGDSPNEKYPPVSSWYASVLVAGLLLMGLSAISLLVRFFKWLF